MTNGELPDVRWTIPSAHESGRDHIGFLGNQDCKSSRKRRKPGCEHRSTLTLRASLPWENVLSRRTTAGREKAWKELAAR